MTTAFALLDADACIEHCNPALGALLGQSHETLTGVSFLSLFDAGDGEAVVAAFGDALAGRSPPPQDTRIATGSRVRWVNLMLSNFTREGSVGQVIALLADRSEQHATRVEIKRQSDLLASILTTATDAIVMIDRSGTITLANAATEQLFGHSAAELVGRNINVLLPQDERSVHDLYLARFAATREAHIIGRPREVQACRKDGTVFPVRLAVNEIDHLMSFIAFMHDMTDSVAMREEIVSVAVLEQQRIGRELHDSTQQALTGLALLAQTLLDRMQAATLSAADHALMRRLVDGLSDAQHEVQQLARGLVPFPIDGAALPGALAALARSVDRSDGIRCVAHCGTRLPVLGAEAATHVYRIAQEAVHNAIRHSNGRHITIDLLMEDASLALRVTDDGHGRHPASVSRSGVGIRLMEHRCSLAGGRLQLTAREGGGTCVLCSVPIPAPVHLVEQATHPAYGD